MERSSKYQELLLEAQGLLEEERDPIAAMANITALIKKHFGFFWVGFYRADIEQKELILGPFQGDIACTRIAYGKGVCGASWKEKQTMIVPNVHDFPGHIACSPHSLSEIVVPFFKDNNKTLIAVLDIDSRYENDFHEEDKIYLEKLRDLYIKFIPH